ncbi:armadillo-type protein, partial [Mycena leptocephala]
MNVGILGFLDKLVDSPNSRVRRSTCLMLGHLAQSPPKVAIVLSQEVCMSLMSCLRDKELGVGDTVMAVLLSFDGLSYLLESPIGRVKRNTCRELALLALDEATLPAVLRLNICERLLPLLLDTDNVIVSALHTLSSIARWPTGAAAVIHVGTLPILNKLVGAPHENRVRKWTCELLGRLAYYQPTAASVMESKPLPHLTDLLRSWDTDIIESVIYALFSIIKWPDGAEAVVSAGIPSILCELLERQSTRVTNGVCTMLGRLALLESTAPRVLLANPTERLVSLLRQTLHPYWCSCLACWKETSMTASAIYALSSIARWLDGAQAVVTAGTLVTTYELIESPNSQVRRSMCELLGNLAHHRSTAVAVMGVNPSATLVSFLGGKDDDIIESAVYALYELTLWPDSARVVVSAGILDFLPILREAESTRIRSMTSTIEARIDLHNL